MHDKIFILTILIDLNTKKSLRNQNFNENHHKISHDSQKRINTETWFLMINDSDVVERKLLFEPTQIHQVLNVFLWILWLDKVWFHEFYEIFDDAFNIILILRSFR